MMIQDMFFCLTKTKNAKTGILHRSFRNADSPKSAASTGTYTKVGIWHTQHQTHIQACCRRRQLLTGQGMHRSAP